MKKSLLFLTLLLNVGKIKASDHDEYGPLVLGGSFASRNEFPWMVRLYIEIPNIDTFVCGAALISEQWLATAAHCVISNSGVQAVQVRAVFGKHDLSQMEAGEMSRSSATGDIFIHDNFKRAVNADYDFALIRLKIPVDLMMTDSATIKPINLPTDDVCTSFDSLSTSVDSCQHATAVGWGTPGPDEYMSLLLKKLPVTIKQFSECRLNYADDYFTEAKICASGGRGAQTCRGDSGGPLSCLIKDHPTLIGITSYGFIACNTTGEEKPSVYSRICAALPWIRDKMRQQKSDEDNNGAKILSPPLLYPNYPPTLPANNPDRFFFPPAFKDCSDPNFVIMATLNGWLQCPLKYVSRTTLRAALFNAIRADFTKVVVELLDSGMVTPDEVENYPRFGYSQSALILAARWVKAETVKILLDRGAPIDATDSVYNRTAAIWAQCEDRSVVVSYLLSRGGSLDGCNCLPHCRNNQIQSTIALFQPSNAAIPKRASGGGSGYNNAIINNDNLYNNYDKTERLLMAKGLSVVRLHNNIAIFLLVCLHFFIFQSLF